MKAIELIKHLEKLIEEEGQDVEVFMSASGYYCSDGKEELQIPEKYHLAKHSFWSIGHSHQSY